MSLRNSRRIAHTNDITASRISSTESDNRAHDESRDHNSNKNRQAKDSQERGFQCFSSAEMGQFEAGR
jgi:hypothetical protein